MLLIAGIPAVLAAYVHPGDAQRDMASSYATHLHSLWLCH